MPTYTVTNDIYDVLSAKIVAQLTDDSNGTDPDTDIIDSALDRMESFVDSYVGKVYSVPLSTPVDGSIKNAVLILAKCQLYKRRPGAIPDEVERDCDKIIEWLEMVASGEAELDPDLDSAADTSDTGNDDEIFDAQIFGR